MDQIRVTRVLKPRLTELGVDLARVLKRAGLADDLFNQPRAMVNTAQFFAFWRALDELNTEPDLGLRLGGRHDRIELADITSLVALSASTFREGLNKLARYKRLFCSEDLRLIQEGEWVWLDAVWYAASEPTPALLTDGMFASWLSLGRSGTGLPLKPVQVWFRRPAPPRAQAQLYQRHFDCPVIFDAGADRLAFAADVLEWPFRSHNPDLLAALVPQLEAELLLRPADTEVARVKALLRSRLAGQAPGISAIASELNLSQRTLQRRLAQEGTGFQQVLEQVRRELALDYLQRLDYDLAEVAYLLGYEETSSFHRAFLQWQGLTPGQWRHQQFPASVML